MLPHLLVLLLSTGWAGYILPLFAAALLLSIAGTALLLRLLLRLRLVDHPLQHKNHLRPTPTMGGLAIAAAACGAGAFFGDFKGISQLAFLAAGTAVLTGVADDCCSLRPLNKLSLQVLAATFLAVGGIRLESLHGLFGYTVLPLPLQYAGTVMVVAAITNAFNLADGIDGLAASLALVSLLVLSALLYATGAGNYSLLAAAVAGAVLGFLYFNREPARIFMGDTGSLLLGCVIALCSLRLLQASLPATPKVPVVVAGLVALPVLDMVRLFFCRLLAGHSPFLPDRNHMHYILTAKGYTHSAAVGLLTLLHVVLIGSGFLFNHTSITTAILQQALTGWLALVLVQQMPPYSPYKAVR